MMKDTPAIIINRENMDPDVTDYFMLAVRFLFPLYLSIAIPINIAPLRAKITTILGKNEPTTWTFHLFWSAFIMAKCATVAYLFPDILNILGVLGGICCTNIMITFPGKIDVIYFTYIGMVYIKLCGLKGGSIRRIAMILLTFIFTIIGFASAALSFLDMIKVIDLKSM